MPSAIFSALALGLFLGQAGVDGVTRVRWEIANGSFEDAEEEDASRPKFWNLINYKPGAGPQLATSVARTGYRSLRFEGRGETNGYQAAIQNVEVTGGATYTFSVYVRNDPSEPFICDDGYGQLVVQWLDGMGNEVGRDWSAQWKSTLSRLQWEPFVLQGVRAPLHAELAAVGIHLYERSGARGAFFADDVSVTTP